MGVLFTSHNAFEFGSSGAHHPEYTKGLHVYIAGLGIRRQNISIFSGITGYLNPPPHICSS
jgi:hypothetical protein